MSQSHNEIHLDFPQEGEPDLRPINEEKHLMRCLLAITALLLVGTGTAILVSYILF